MKLTFSILLFCVGLAGCGNAPDEVSEFIRLEKDLATVAKTDDKVEFQNPESEYEMGERLAEYTDSSLAIAADYDSLILQSDQSDYSQELQHIQEKLERRKAKRRYGEWEDAEMDAYLTINPNLDTEFRKYCLRIKLSRAFAALYSINYCGNYAYDIFETHHFLVYQQYGDTLEGEYGLGYIVSKDLFAKLRLIHNGKTIPPDTSSASCQKTEAIFTPRDTGIHILEEYTITQDPITGQWHKLGEQRKIYVKP